MCSGATGPRKGTGYRCRGGPRGPESSAIRFLAFCPESLIPEPWGGNATLRAKSDVREENSQGHASHTSCHTGRGPPASLVHSENGISGCRGGSSQQASLGLCPAGHCETQQEW